MNYFSPTSGLAGEGVHTVRTQGPCVRLPHLTSHDFLSHSPKSQPHQAREASDLFSGAGGFALSEQIRFQADCLPLGPAHLPVLDRSVVSDSLQL